MTDDGSDGESARNSPSTRKQKQCNADVLEETNSTCIDVTTAAKATRPLSAAEQVQTVHGGDAVTIVAETEEAHSEAQEVTERNPTLEFTDPQTADSVSALELVTEEQGNGTRKKDAVEAASVTTVVKIDNPNDGALNQDVRRRRLKTQPNLKASRNQSKQQPAQEEATAKNVLYEIITERPKEVPSSDISDAKPLVPAITTTEFPPLSVVTSHPSVPDCDLQNKKRPLETTDDGSDGESARNSPSTRKQKQCNADVLEETNSTCIDVTTAAKATRPLSAAEQVQTVHGGDAVTIVAETEEAHSEAQEVTERNPTLEFTDPQTADSVSALELVTEEQGNGTRKKDAVEAASVTTVVKIDNPNDGALNQDVRRRRLKTQPNLKASRNQSKQQPAQEEATAKNVLYEIITERPKEVPSSDISDAKPLVPAITTTEFPPLSVVTSHPSVPDCDLQNKKRPLETTDDGSDGESARNSPSTRKQKQCNADVLEETNSTCIDVTTAAEATRPLSAAEQVQTVHGGDAVTIVAETEEAHSEAQEVTERNPTQELTDPQTADSVSALELVTEEQGNGTRKKDAVEAASVTTVVKIDNPNDGALNQDVRRRRLKPLPTLKASRNQSKQQPAQEEATAKNVLYEIITERPKEVPSSDISDAKPLGKTKTRDVRNPAPK
ncbi:uncharacterized protein LOC126302899 [Schistocerca gregaria]|uniref:uncharacterized protein LOC126302899 n=1 Tax=Schistocerca gregaria TaxID=7010 RepID=UPI00211DB2AD|nr:uncharacterized protein LOC126302899 [Schistocerca gregaria]